MDTPPQIVLPQTTLVGPLQPQWKGVMKIIESYEVEQHTNDGWLVLGCFEKKDSYACDGKEPRACAYPEGHYSNGSEDGTVETNRSIQVSSWMFIVGYDKDRTIKEKNDCIVALEETAREVAKADKERSKEFEGLQGRLESLQSNETYHREQSERHQKEVGERDEQIRKMKADIVKVRSAIGGLKFDEIVGQGKEGESTG